MAAAGSSPSVTAAIVGVAGCTLDVDERRLIQRGNPWGFILFARNCASPVQVRSLVDGLRAAVGRPDAPVLIDQEGGRVQRLQPPHWPARPAARQIGALAAQDLVAGREAATPLKVLIGPEGKQQVIDIISVMAFRDDGKIASMRAFWSADAIRPATPED